LYYALELPLYYLLKSFRMALVMTGYLLPMDDEVSLVLSHIGLSGPGIFADVLGANGDIFGGLLGGKPLGKESFRDKDFPHSIPVDEDGDPNEFRAPWKYPTSPTEMHNRDLQNEPMPASPILNSSGDIAITGGPYAAFSSPAILFGGVNQDPMIRDRIESALTASDADVVGMSVTPTRHLGDSVAFCEYLIWLESRDPVQKDGTKVPLVEWNLDADFGYGYHCWDWNRRDETVEDPEGNPFGVPCTPPEQADHDLLGAVTSNWWTPATRLQIHWVGPGLSDPGCRSAAAPSRDAKARRRVAAPKARRRKKP
jgi:hypothetical protein